MPVIESSSTVTPYKRQCCPCVQTSTGCVTAISVHSLTCMRPPMQASRRSKRLSSEYLIRWKRDLGRKAVIPISFLSKRPRLVILSEARRRRAERRACPERSEGTCFASFVTRKEKKKQVLRACGAQDDMRVALVLGDWRERRKDSPRLSLCCCF